VTRDLNETIGVCTCSKVLNGNSDSGRDCDTKVYGAMSKVMMVILILIMKANEMHCFSDLFDKVLYMFRTSPLSIIRSILTQYTRNRYFSC